MVDGVDDDVYVGGDDQVYVGVIVGIGVGLDLVMLRMIWVLSLLLLFLLLKVALIMLTWVVLWADDVAGFWFYLLSRLTLGWVSCNN